MILAPRILKISGGQVEPRAQANLPNSQYSRVITYDHSVRQKPCQYNTEAVKELRKQNHQLRLKFQQIQLAYSKLLVQSRSLSQFQNMFLDDNSKSETTKATAIDYKGNDMKSSFIKQLDDIQDKNEFKNTQLGRLSQSRFEDQDDEDIRKEQKKLFLEKESENRRQQIEEGEDIGQQLGIAFQQINELKTILMQVKNNSTIEIERLKKDHEQEMNRMQYLLKEQRNNNRNLHELIMKLRQQMKVSQALQLEFLDIKQGQSRRIRQKQRWRSDR